MPTDAIVDGIRRRTDLESDEEARQTLEATLQTLGERISREEGKDLAYFLPEDLEVQPIDWDSASEGDFDFTEFLSRLTDRSSADSREQAQQHAQATMESLTDEVPEPELERVYTQLPTEYNALFGSAV